MIMSVILLTTLFYKALMLEGEIWRSSLLGPVQTPNFSWAEPNSN